MNWENVQVSAQDFLNRACTKSREKSSSVCSRCGNGNVQRVRHQLVDQIRAPRHMERLVCLRRRRRSCKADTVRFAEASRGHNAFAGSVGVGGCSSKSTAKGTNRAERAAIRREDERNERVELNHVVWDSMFTSFLCWSCNCAAAWIPPRAQLQLAYVSLCREFFFLTKPADQRKHIPTHCSPEPSLWYVANTCFAV